MLEPSEQAATHLHTGAALYEAQDLEGARVAFEAALAVQPDLTPARFNLAVICREFEENDQAETLFREVIAAREIEAEAYNNLGILAVRREEYEVGLNHFRKAIELRDQFPLAHFNLGTLLLRLAQWEEGWREFEWRWQTPTFTPIQCAQPHWDGRPLHGTLLLHTEQGIGDTFQFARFIPAIRERCRRVIFVRPEPLDCMFPEDQWADEVRSAGEIPLDSFDAVLPLMSAPRVLGTQLDDLPCQERYLTPAAREVDLGPTHVPGATAKVGITWGGSPTHVNDTFRSTSIEEFLPILQVPRIAFYSLQMGPRADELNRLGSEISLIRDLRDLQQDFADTAAIVRQLDLVITVDTSVLHLAGGMGIPAWGLLSRRSDWRWMGNERTDTPWYRSVRLFRQTTCNEWRELMQRVAVALGSELGC